MIYMARILNVEGIGKTYAEKLASMGITTTEMLLETCGTRQGRVQDSEKTGISEKLILEWVNLSDLFRIRGVGEQYSDLLEEAGVDTVAELAQRNPENLFNKMLEVNKVKNLVNRTPWLSVESWIEQAKGLPRMVEY
jgi:predicted flap endonuclease-1-like 5' DNA nuclease